MPFGTGTIDAMPSPIRQLSEAECRERLQHHGFIGRLGFVAGGHPMILPVNYVADGDSIAFCTEAGTKLDSLAGGADVVFEIDDSRPLYRSGWSVVITGKAREVTNHDELARLRSGPLRSWAVGPDAHWVRIEVREISGREIAEE